MARIYIDTKEAMGRNALRGLALRAIERNATLHMWFMSDKLWAVANDDANAHLLPPADGSTVRTAPFP